MSKYKLCPVCSYENNPASLECENCGADLMSIAITDTEVIIIQEQEQPVAEKKPDKENEPLVRICTCGQINPSQARKCSRCNEDISDILPTKAAAELQGHFQLSEVGGNYTFTVPCGSMIIGRNHGMRECLTNKPYVSRMHAKLVVENGTLYIENLSSTNYTYVNNIRIPNGRIPLKIGDEVSLGGTIVNGVRQDEAAYFIVEQGL